MSTAAPVRAPFLGVWLALVALVAALGTWQAHAELAVPPLKARVTDLTGTLSASQRDTLERKLAAFEGKKGSQIAVLLVPTTQPETIEQYSIRVAEAWKLGRKGVDDGALLLVAKNDRRLRIEVGYGLEGALTDLAAKRIVSDIITPQFKQGDFFAGIDAGVTAMIAVIEGEPLPAPKRTATTPAFDLEGLLVIGLIMIIGVGGVLRAIFGRLFGSGIIAGIVGAVAWVMIGSFLVAVIVGVIAFVIGLVAGTHGLRPSGGWGGSSGGWSSGGGGFGGGGFSGGGGSFGGGGSSGSW